MFRPLHAKAVWLENDRFIGLMLGSSNFTAAGMGLAKTEILRPICSIALQRNENGVSPSCLLLR